MKFLVLILGMLLSVTTHAEMQWVSGKVETVEDFGSYGGGSFQVLIKLIDQEWHNAGNGASACTNRFKAANGQLGMTEEVKNRIFSMMLSAYMANKPVALYVDNATGPYCYVQIGRVGIGTY